jgi:replication factor A1
MSITPGALQSVYSQPNESSSRRVVQILSVSSLAGQTGRYKMILSDGETYTTGLLASHFIQTLGGTCPFKQFQLVSLDHYQVNSVNDKHFLLIHGLSEVTPPLPNGQIGNPVAYRSTGIPASTASNPPNPSLVASVATGPPVNNYSYPQIDPVPQQSAGFVNPYIGGAPPSSQPKPPSAQLARHPSMPSHTPFAAGMQQSLPQVPYQHSGSSGPVRYMQPVEQVLPMSQLTIYTQKWTIRARVATKSDMRTFRNAKGEGQLMTVDLVDSEQSEMRATFFGSAAQKFFPILTVGKVFNFSRGSVKPANPKFNPRAQYELMFDEHSEIQEVVDDGSIPSMKLSIVPIATIANAAVGNNVDIAGIVTNVGEVGLVTIKSTGKETPRRTVTMVDDSGCSIELTIWGERAEKLGEELKACQNPIVFVKGCRVGDFNTRSLSTAPSSQIEIDPDHPRSFELKAWWMKSGSRETITALSVQGSGLGAQGGMGGPPGTSSPTDRTTIQNMRADDVANLVASTGFAAMQNGAGRTVNSHLVKATIVHIPIRDTSSLYYKSCMTEVDDGRGGRRLCQKKAELQGGDTYVCAEQHMNRSANPRYILSMRIQDPSGECLVRAFHDQGKAILGIDAAEIDSSPNPSVTQQLAIDKALFRPFVFKIRSKKEVHMDEERMNMVVSDVQPVNPNSDARYMLANIRQFLNRST